MHAKELVYCITHLRPKNKKNRKADFLEYTTEKSSQDLATVDI